MDLFQEFKKLSITSYLINRGLFPEKGEKFNGNSRTLFSSPFSNDSSPSFWVYENTNSFYDFSTGKGGDIIRLVEELEGCSAKEALVHLADGELLPIATDTVFSRRKVDKAKFKNFNYEKYLLRDIETIEAVRTYARSRGITKGYKCGQFYVTDGEDLEGKPKWRGVPCIMFIHIDEDLDICGVKFREIDPQGKTRFNSRGRLCYHMLANVLEDEPTVYVVESETSANSLWEILKEFEISSVIFCIGGVNQVPERLPNDFKDYECKIIIDYDGDEDLYNERVRKFSHLGEGIKIPLPKGEDINSLYNKNEYEFLKELL